MRALYMSAVQASPVMTRKRESMPLKTSSKLSWSPLVRLPLNIWTPTIANVAMPMMVKSRRFMREGRDLSAVSTSSHSFGIRLKNLVIRRIRTARTTLMRAKSGVTCSSMNPSSVTSRIMTSRASDWRERYFRGPLAAALRTNSRQYTATKAYSVLRSMSSLALGMPWYSRQRRSMLQPMQAMMKFSNSGWCTATSKLYCTLYQTANFERSR
mmetsp:Transcript_4449/g.10481  ORF Transcript_4449/g.10481 Transcript_4449/m.10481 type:complete len:212 (-) Transcript_4449:363-998(-)